MYLYQSYFIRQVVCRPRPEIYIYIFNKNVTAHSTFTLLLFTIPRSLEVIFIVKSQGLHVLLSEIWQCIFTYFVIPC